MLKKRQAGITLISVMIGGAFIAFVLLMGMRSIPVFVEYNAVKRIFKEMKGSVPPTMSEPMIRREFETRSSIDDVQVKKEDIEINREGGGVSLSVGYERRIPIVANAYLVYVFSLNSDDL